MRVRYVKNELNLCSEIVVAFGFENLSIGVRRGRGELYSLRLEDVEMKNNTEKSEIIDFHRFLPEFYSELRLQGFRECLLSTSISEKREEIFKKSNALEG